MYQLKTEADFDSAHFLSGYTGKCSNIHGHRWHVEIEIESRKLEKNGQGRGMLVDFGDLKKDLRELADSMDHTPYSREFFRIFFQENGRKGLSCKKSCCLRNTK